MPSGGGSVSGKGLSSFAVVQAVIAAIIASTAVAIAKNLLFFFIVLIV